MRTLKVCWTVYTAVAAAVCFALGDIVAGLVCTAAFANSLDVWS